MARVLIVGSGAREHALGHGLRGHDLLFAPGNAGTRKLGENLLCGVAEVDRLVEAAAERRVDLVVVGPELPLTLGLTDALAARGVKAFGPSRAAARLEASKVFMKEFAKRCGIPTADFRVFSDAEDASRYIREANRPLVVKADGLAAGKGVVVAPGRAEALEAVERMMVRREFGGAGARVVIEELLAGEEASFHVVCDGVRGVALAAAQDHKRLADGDKGPNTGGMGAYAPAPIVTPRVRERVMDEIVEPTLRGMSQEGAPFRGVLFVGLMIDNGEPRLLEYNVRFGDPEATVIVPLADDWFDLLDASACGNVSRFASAAGTSASRSALSVVLAAEGYPAHPVLGDRISGLDEALGDGALAFHAGTKIDPLTGHVVTAGGRVVTVVGVADKLDHARERAYEGVRRIHFRGQNFRSDIGFRALG